MFRRKLTALGYPSPETANLTEEKQFRSVVLWLEDTKICCYKIDERKALRQTGDKSWNEAFEKYLRDLDCPHGAAEQKEALDWLLGYAIHLEVSDNKEKYNVNALESRAEHKTETSGGKANPLDNLDFGSAEFKAGVNTLADLFKVAKHPDHLVTLEAISILVQEKLAGSNGSESTVKDSDQTPFPFEEAPLGLDSGDPAVNQAARILRLLFISDLRNLQTSINEAIVDVQSLTANPKTDTKMGKVGC